MSAKTITNSQMIGNRGIALIHSIVSDMGYIWHPMGELEAGIDGIIEIRDEATGEVRNCIVQVQSKATEKSFPMETEEYFEYVCKEKDISYWLAGNAPVIIVFSKPNMKEAYWINVKEYFNDPARRLERKVKVMKCNSIFARSTRFDLFDISKPNDSGLYLAPIPKSEVLYSNLLEVISFPTHLHIADIDIRDPKEVYSELRRYIEPVPNEWVLHDKRIYTFHKIRDYPWNKFCDLGTAEIFETGDWALSNDIPTRRIFVWLLNLCLRTMLRKQGVGYDKREDAYYFYATKTLSNKRLLYKHLKSSVKRNVFRAYESKTNRERIAYYRHSAFQGRFVRFNMKWYLEITPTYRYTSDGRRISRYSEDRKKGIKRLERNSSLLGQLMMWLSVLRVGSDLFDSPYPYLELGDLVTYECKYGLDDNEWSPQSKPASVTASPMQSRTRQMFR